MHPQKKKTLKGSNNVYHTDHCSESFFERNDLLLFSNLKYVVSMYQANLLLLYVVWINRKNVLTQGATHTNHRYFAWGAKTMKDKLLSPPLSYQLFFFFFQGIDFHKIVREKCFEITFIYYIVVRRDILIKSLGCSQVKPFLNSPWLNVY